MAYGTNLDSLNDAILQEGAQRDRRAASNQQYLLGLAGERTRGRQVDVNQQDANTRGRAVDVEERLGNRRYDVMGDEIASRERIANVQAAINRQLAATDELYKRGIIGDMERGRAIQKIQAEGNIALGNRAADLGVLQAGIGYDLGGRQLDINSTLADIERRRVDGAISAQQAASEVAALGIASRDANEKAQLAQQAKLYDAQSKLLTAQANLAGNPRLSEGAMLELMKQGDAQTARALPIMREANYYYDRERGWNPWGGWFNRDEPIDVHLADAAKKAGDEGALRFIERDPTTGRARLRQDIGFTPSLMPGYQPPITGTNRPPGRVAGRMTADGQFIPVQ